MKEWFISHITSSPHYPQSNGLAENGVKAMKKILHCCYNRHTGKVDEVEWTKAISIYLNTPKARAKHSPAEIVFGRMIRDVAGAGRQHYLAQHNAAVDRRREEVERFRKQRQEEREANRANNVKIGDRVFVQDRVSLRWDRQGLVIDYGRNERELTVRTDNGGCIVRNRRFLKLANPWRKQRNAPSQRAELPEAPTTPSSPVLPSRKRGRPRGSTNRKPERVEPARASTRSRKTVVRFGTS